MADALVDTSILIAAGGEQPAPDLTGFEGLHVSSISYSELAGGIAVATGVARARRQARFSDIQRVYGEGLPYDDDCAREYLLLTELVVAAGRSHRVHILDRMIAATARAHGLTVLTRNMADFKPMSELVTVEER
jgi:hypothetical protein